MMTFVIYTKLSLFTSQYFQQKNIPRGKDIPPTQGPERSEGKRRPTILVTFSSSNLGDDSGDKFGDEFGDLQILLKNLMTFL